MKKIFIILVLFVSLFFSINRVSALENGYVSNFYNFYDFWATLEDNQDYPSDVISTLVSMYNANTDTTIYPYYVIWKTGNDYITLTASDTSDIKCSNSNGNILCHFDTSHASLPNFAYSPQNSSYISELSGGTYLSSTIFYSSNTTLHFKSWTSYYDGYTSLQLPSYSNLDLDVSYPLTTINDGDAIPTYYSLTNGQPTADFTQVDMSQYAYIILSLKDYTSSAFNTTIYSLGRLCLTAVYNYGMTEKKEYYNNFQTAGCTEYYNTSTPVMVFVDDAFLSNYGVFYIKRYETETNILQVPTSIFDITYVSQADANNPNVIINGRSYPSIPYSQLTDTANKSTNENYISGQACVLGDVNCEYENGIGLDISKIFTQPLVVLENVWTSISTIFILIGKFLALIPSPLREFLIASFMLAIILGLVKIII